MVLGEELYLIFLLPYVGIADKERPSFQKHLYFPPLFSEVSNPWEKIFTGNTSGEVFYLANFKGKHFSLFIEFMERSYCI